MSQGPSSRRQAPEALEAAVEGVRQVGGHRVAAIDEGGAQLPRQRGAVAGAVEQRDQPAAALVLDADLCVAEVGHELPLLGLVAGERRDPRALAGVVAPRRVDVELHQVGGVGAQQRGVQHVAIAVARSPSVADPDAPRATRRRALAAPR